MNTSTGFLGNVQCVTQHASFKGPNVLESLPQVSFEPFSFAFRQHVSNYVDEGEKIKLRQKNFCKYKK